MPKLTSAVFHFFPVLLFPLSRCQHHLLLRQLPGSANWPPYFYFLSTPHFFNTIARESFWTESEIMSLLSSNSQGPHCIAISCPSEPLTRSFWPHLPVFLSPSLPSSSSGLWSLCYCLKTQGMFLLAFSVGSSCCLEWSSPHIPVLTLPSFKSSGLGSDFTYFVSPTLLNHYSKNRNPVHPVFLSYILFYHTLCHLLNSRWLFVLWFVLFIVPH